MKTKIQKETKSRKIFKALIFFSVISIIIVFALNSESSLGSKYSIHSAGDASYGSEVSYINLTGERTIEDKKIKLSEGYWTGGKFDF